MLVGCRRLALCRDLPRPDMVPVRLGRTPSHESLLAMQHNLPVPRISAFYGVVIWMYYDDHNPPHFHAT